MVVRFFPGPAGPVLAARHIDRRRRRPQPLRRRRDPAAEVAPRLAPEPFLVRREARRVVAGVPDPDEIARPAVVRASRAKLDRPDTRGIEDLALPVCDGTEG